MIKESCITKGQLIAVHRIQDEGNVDDQRVYVGQPVHGLTPIRFGNSSFNRTGRYDPTTPRDPYFTVLLTSDGLEVHRTQAPPMPVPS